MKNDDFFLWPKSGQNFPWYHVLTIDTHRHRTAVEVESESPLDGRRFPDRNSITIPSQVYDSAELHKPGYAFRI